MSYVVRCGHPFHVERFAEPEWFDGVLIRHTRPGPAPLIVYCGGCAAADARLIVEPVSVEKMLEELRADVATLKEGAK